MIRWRPAALIRRFFADAGVADVLASAALKARFGAAADGPSSLD
jgi:hypothetical protein